MCMCMCLCVGGGCASTESTEVPREGLWIFVSFNLSPPTRTGRVWSSPPILAPGRVNQWSTFTSGDFLQGPTMGSPGTVGYPSFKMSDSAVMQPAQPPEFLCTGPTTNLTIPFPCLPPTNTFFLSFQFSFSKKKFDRFSSPSQDKLFHASLPANELILLCRVIIPDLISIYPQIAGPCKWENFV